MVVAPRPPA